MPPRKRTNDDGETSTRAKKSAKTEAGESASAKTSKPRGAAAKTAPTFDTFKEKALPIHVSFTHTPPSIDRADETTKPASSKGKAKDEGYIGNLTLVPSKFGTGSYGWKGTKKIEVMLEGEDGKKEKVTVQIQINAPVHGSKNTKPSSKKAKGESDDEEEQAAVSDDE